MTTMDVEGYARAIRAASDWLVSRLQPDGSYGEEAKNVSYYYKAPWALAASGEARAASVVGDYVRKRFLKDDGDLIISKSPVPLYNQWVQQHYLYYSCWLTYGLQKIGRFDATYRTMNFIRSFQNREFGGFYSNKEMEHMDTLTTSICGLCCLSTGRSEEAIKAGQFLGVVLHKQNDKDRFYTSLSKGGKLVKDFPKDRKLYYVIEKTELGQWYFYVGLPIAFLVKLFEASGREGYLELARRYFDIAEGCREDAFAGFGTGKLAWGSSLLYRHLRNKKYHDAAISISDGLFRSQTKEGAFLTIRANYRSLEEQPLLISIDVTAETIALGSETMQALY